jgi:hypothetical protein
MFRKSHALPASPSWDKFCVRHNRKSTSQTQTAESQRRGREAFEELRMRAGQEKVDFITEIAKEGFSPEDLEDICGIISNELVHRGQIIEALTVLAHSPYVVSTLYDFINDQLKINTHPSPERAALEEIELVDLLSGLLSHLDCMEKPVAQSFICRLNHLTLETFKSLLENLIKVNKPKALLYLVNNKAQLPVEKGCLLDAKVNSGQVAAWINDLGEGKISPKLTLLPEQYEGLWLKGERGERVRALNTVAEALVKAWQDDLVSRPETFPSLRGLFEFLLDVTKDLESPDDKVNVLAKLFPHMDVQTDKASETFRYIVLNLPSAKRVEFMEYLQCAGGGGRSVWKAIDLQIKAIEQERRESVTEGEPMEVEKF